MDDLEIVTRAQHALSDPSPQNIAERLILFRPLLQLLEEVLVMKKQTTDQRRCIREAVYDFVYRMKQIRDALEDWDLGLALTKDLVQKLDNLERCLNELQIVLLADTDTPPAMMASNDPSEGQEF